MVGLAEMSRPGGSLSLSLTLFSPPPPTRVVSGPPVWFAGAGVSMDEMGGAAKNACYEL